MPMNAFIEEGDNTVSPNLVEPESDASDAATHTVHVGILSRHPETKRAITEEDYDESSDYPFSLWKKITKEKIKDAEETLRRLEKFAQKIDQIEEVREVKENMEALKANERTWKFIADWETPYLKELIELITDEVKSYCSDKDFAVENFKVVASQDPEKITNNDDLILQILIDLDEDFRNFQEAMKVEESITKKIFKATKDFKSSQANKEAIEEADSVLLPVLDGVYSLPIEE